MVATSLAEVGSWVEREIPLSAAEQRARRAIADLPATPELTEISAGRTQSVWRCRLRDGAGAVLRQGSGNGKGSAAEARTGALFEALEHYLTGPERFDAATVTFHSGPELAAGPFAEDACGPVLAGLDRVACHDYAPVPHGSPVGSARLPVPVCVATSWYFDTPQLRESLADETDYTGLVRYGSNNGSAIGTSLAEALVHALNECIERDALSLLLARTGFDRSYRVRVVDPATLPAELAAARAEVQHSTGRPVHLLEITTDLGVPAYAAASPAPGSFELRHGFGASLSPRYAAWRALGELAQVAALSTVVPAEQLRALAPLDALSRYPALRACAEFDVAAHLSGAEVVAFPVGEKPLPPPRQQARRLAGLLADAGFPPHYRVAASLPDGITAAHVFVPGLERFMIVTSGMLVLPGPRARARLAAS